MVSYFFLLHFHFCITTMVIILFLAANGEDVHYSACSLLYWCGNITVGYPFWGDNRPMLCGIPELKLKCSKDGENHPILYPFQNGYIASRVLSINMNSHTIRISRNQLFNTCHLENKNVTLLPPLKLVAGYKDISLFYGCANNCSMSKSMSCANDDGTYGTAYYFDFEELSAVGKMSKSCSCKNNITFPVDDRVLDELRSTKDDDHGSLLSILTKWPIEMMYKANFTACSECQTSGGRCGSSDDSNQFVCYCRDGSHSWVCPQSDSAEMKRTTKGLQAVVLIIVSILGAGIGICMLIVVILYFKRKPSSKKRQNVEAFLKSYGSPGPKRYSYTDLKRITGSFKHKLGEGGYGVVYKGKLRNDHLVAVKILKKSEGDMEEFINEVASIGKTNHINIVKLLGFCYEGQKRALVYNYMPNGSLEKFTYGGQKNHQPLSWETLYEIAVGIARGLEYLHRGCNTRILHFDIKPQNILLDENFCPKISDFGLAKSCAQKESIISMSEARGTIGYIAPEVFLKCFGGVSHKSDVYSYGMLVLEMIGCRNNADAQVECSSEQYFPDWIYKQLEQVKEVDSEGITNSEEGSLRRKMVLVSLWCTQTSPSSRPTMTRVLEMLEGTFETLQIPPMPSFASPLRSKQNTSTMPTISIDSLSRE